MRDRQHTAAVRWLYRIGWRVGPFVPATVQRAIARTGARVAYRRDGVHIAQLRDNLRIATGRPVPVELLRRAITSYLRNLIEMFALPGWSRAEIIANVATTGEDRLRRAVGDTGVVVALPHSGNWDLAGAWACTTGLPVTTVVEELDEPEYSAFRSFREQLGMHIVPHREPTVLTDLTAAVTAGRVVCLVADRDLLGSGLQVSWAGHRVTLPAGPAVVARRTGAALLPASATFTATGIRLDIGEPVPSRPGRDGLRWMTQRLADFFADQVAKNPQDWHLMQPFFPDHQQPAVAGVREPADARDPAAGTVRRRATQCGEPA